MVRPVSMRAVSSASPRNTRGWLNSAFRMRSPVTCGARLRTTVSTSGSSGIGKFDRNFPGVQAHRVHGYVPGRIEIILARTAIEIPRMPRTSHAAPVDRALSQRAALMGAGTAQRVDLALDIAN